MKVLELGHINLLVRSLDFASEFYRETLGFPEVARGTLRGRRIAFYSLGPGTTIWPWSKSGLLPPRRNPSRWA